LSALCGLIGLHTSTQANVRTALACINPINAVHAGMVIAFKSGAVMSMSVVTSVLWGVTLTFLLLRSTISMEDFSQHISGFAFGVSVVALFARVGGGVFAKAADVGADIMGKFEEGLDEDDPNNPATIADNVGDNVGDVAGVGADLFESFASSLIAAAILGHVEFGFPGVALPFWVAGVGTWGSVIGCLVIIYGGNAHSLSNLSLADDLADQRPLLPHRDDARGNDDDSDLPSHDYNAYGSWGLLTAGERDVQATHLVAQSERVQHALLAIVRKGAFAALLLTALGSALSVGATFGPAHPKAWAFFGCIVAGLVVGSLLAYITEFCTAYSCAPTRSVALQARSGPATVVLQGLSVGLLSAGPIAGLLVLALLLAWGLAGVYGVSLAAVGILSTLGVSLAANAFGPVADNARGIVAMAPQDELSGSAGKNTELLDALGNTLAAGGKVFSTGSAALSSMALMCAFSKATNLDDVSVLNEVVACARSSAGKLSVK